MIFDEDLWAHSFSFHFITPHSEGVLSSMSVCSPPRPAVLLEEPGVSAASPPHPDHLPQGNPAHLTSGVGLSAVMQICQTNYCHVIMQEIAETMINSRSWEKVHKHTDKRSSSL